MKILVVVSDRVELAAFDDRFIKTVSGIGPVFAAAAAADSIIRYRPDVVVSAGSAGSLGKLDIGDCVSFGSVVYADIDLSAYHLRIGTSLTPDRRTFSSIRLASSSEHILATSAAFASSRERYSSFNASAADMEAYGVAYSAYLESIPCLAVKAITDIVGEKPEIGEYRKKLKEVRAKLPEMVQEEVAAL